MILGAWLKQIGKPVHLIDAKDWKDAPAELARFFRPGGVFTTMRLDNSKGAATPICLSIHIDRLLSIQTTKSILYEFTLENEMGTDSSLVEQELSEFISSNLMQRFNEYRWLGLTVMLAPSTYLTSSTHPVPTFGYCLKVMEEAPKSCTVLACRTKGRSDPTIKSTKWIEDRKTLKDLIKGTDHNEVLIIDETSHEILEGLSSNFGVLTKDGRMVSAPDSMVLPGSVMKLMKEACKDMGIPINEKCPNIDEAGEWQAAFITSTSRLVLPITEIAQIGYEKTIKIDSLSSTLLQQIQEHIKHSITQR